MLKQTTLKLARSIFGSIIIGAVITLLIVMSFGGIGAKSTSKNSSSSLPTTSSSSSQVSSSSTSSSSVASTSAVTSQGAQSNSQKAALQTSTGGLIETTGGKILLGGLSILIVFFLIYNSSWQEGFKDPNRIQYGHMKKFMAKGFVAGLIAAIPFFIYTTAFLIVKAVDSSSNAYVIMNVIYRFLNMQYVVFTDAWINMPVVCYLLLLFFPIASSIGYIAGFKGIVIASRIMYKNKGNKSARQTKFLNKLKR